MTCRVRLITIALLGLVASLAASPASHAEVGIGDDAYLRREFPQAVADARALGVGSIRVSLSWAAAQPTAGSPVDVSDVISLIDRIDAAGFDVDVMVWSPPAWATDKPCGNDVSVPLVAPTVTFMRAAARALQGRVRTIIVLNEPNAIERAMSLACVSAWRDRYVQILNGAAPAIREAGATVMVGGLQHGKERSTTKVSPWSWLDALYERNADFDAIGIHPYAFSPDEWAGTASKARGTVDLANVEQWAARVDELWPAERVVETRHVEERRVRSCTGRCRTVLRPRQVCRGVGSGRTCTVVMVRVRICRHPTKPTRRVCKWVTRHVTVVERTTVPAPLKDIRISEMGYLTGAPATAPNTAYSTEAQQATWVTAALSWFRSQHRISLFSWMLVDDDPSWPIGLRRYDGSHKPALRAWCTWAGRGPATPPGLDDACP